MAMAQDFGCKRSARQHLALYQRVAPGVTALRDRDPISLAKRA
jgi:hypothetical protein